MINNKLQIFGAWCGVYYLVILGIGFWFFPDFIPPHDPAAGSAEIAAIFQADFFKIRIGMVINMFGALIIMPFSLAIAMEIKQVEGGTGMLTMWQLMGGLSTAILTFYPAMWWLLASYRPDRAPELIQLINDAAWLQFIGGLSIFLPCFITVAIASFMDKREQPVFPRWIGYVSIWSCVLFLPGQLIFFFHGGPFAWNGILGFWVPITAIMAWFFLMTYQIRKVALIRIKAES